VSAPGVLVRRIALRLGAGGFYVLGLPYLRRRKSSFIHGAEDDARELTAHLAAYLDSKAERATPLRAVAT
jgi:putative flavoprotein involved in K+ transport